MSKWLLLLYTGCLVIIAVSTSPIINESESKRTEELAARQTNEVAAPVVVAPAAPPAPASPPASTEDDDDDDDDLDLTDDDDDDDEEGEAASDDDEDDDDDYDFERILDDILGDKKPVAAKTPAAPKRKPTAKPWHRIIENNHTKDALIKLFESSEEDDEYDPHHILIQLELLEDRAEAGNPSENSSKKPVRAKATLFGLSSLRRDSDIDVNVMNSQIIVSSKFLVEPLTLKVEKEFGRGATKELRSATATTAEMFGKLNLKVVHGGDASLNSIKVMQPKQMRIQTDNDNKTTEFIWKRSANLAHLVSQKLTNAARSLLAGKK